MKVEIKRFLSPDILDLENYKPENPKCFCFLLQFYVGPVNKSIEESFDILVCTPSWLEENTTHRDVVFGKDHLLVFDYNFKSIVEKLSIYVDQLEQESWADNALMVDRIAKWEFRDYHS